MKRQKCFEVPLFSDLQLHPLSTTPHQFPQTQGKLPLPVDSFYAYALSEHLSSPSKLAICSRPYRHTKGPKNTFAAANQVSIKKARAHRLPQDVSKWQHVSPALPLTADAAGRHPPRRCRLIPLIHSFVSSRNVHIRRTC